MTPIDRIPCHPGRFQARVQRAREHAGGQFRFRRKADLGRHMRFEASVWILGPALGEVQRAVQQRMTCLAGIGEEDAELTILDAPCCPAVLALHSHRLIFLFYKARFIDDENRRYLYHCPLHLW